MGPNLGPVTIGKLLNLSVSQLPPLEKEFIKASTQYGCCRDYAIYYMSVCKMPGTQQAVKILAARSINITSYDS